MPFIGNIPAESYASFETETFTVSATANYTLSHAVTNENEIRLVINGVVQQPGSGKAYTASGTTLTLSSATASGDVMYAVYLGRALQTVNPPNASVGASQLADDAVTTAKILDANVTSAKLASGVLPTNTPAFSAYLSSAQSLGNNVNTKIICDTELFDTNNMYNTSTGVFTPTVAGKYFLYAKIFYSGAQNEGIADIYLQKNGSSGVSAFRLRPSGTSGQAIQVCGYAIANGTTDNFELQTYHAAGAGITAESGDGKTIFSAFKIIE